MAEHERYVAKFYLRQDNMRAAENRVKSLLEKFPDTVATTKALEDLATAYERRGDTAAAEKVPRRGQRTRRGVREHAGERSRVARRGRRADRPHAGGRRATRRIGRDVRPERRHGRRRRRAGPHRSGAAAEASTAAAGNPGSYGSVGSGGGGLGRRY